MQRVVQRCPKSQTMAPFPHPAHRTGLADLPHPALGQNIMPSPTAGCCRAQSSMWCWRICAKESANAAAKVMSEAGFDVSTACVDVSSRESVHELVHRATGLVADYRGYSCRWCLSLAGLFSRHPQSRPVWHGGCLVGIWQRDLPGWISRGDRFAVGPPPTRVDARAEQGIGNHTDGAVAGPADVATRSSERPIACLSVVQARERAAGHGSGCAAGASAVRA